MSDIGYIEQVILDEMVTNEPTCEVDSEKWPHNCSQKVTHKLSAKCLEDDYRLCCTRWTMKKLMQMAEHKYCLYCHEDSADCWTITEV